MNIFNKAQKDVAEQSNKTEKTVHSLDDAFRAISPSTLSAVAGVTALVGSIKALTSAGQNIINITSQFEQTQKSLETVLQSAEKGQQLFEDLRKFSFDTTFGIDELASASSQLLNVGVGVEKLKGQLKTLGDLAQGDKNKFAELTSIFAKVQSTGKATSMQLNQFALRGIPIIQTLKDMGVQGTASAEDLTKAFEKLTGEGGQFHDAMNNIIDTIEGKQGFITDTLKEINVNFGSLTGITDTYKEMLDAVYEILNGVNEKLIEWNENPVMKAILSGLLTTAITGLVAVVGVSLVSALKAVAVQLGVIAGLKTLISPVGAVAGLVAVLGGLFAVKKSFDNSMEKSAENVEKFAKASEDAKKALQEANNLRSVGVVTEDKFKSTRLKSEQQYLEGLKEGAKKRQEKVLELKAELEEWGGENVHDYDSFQEVKTLREQIAYYENVDKYAKKVIANQEELVKGLEEEEAKYIKLNDSISEFAELQDSVKTKDDKEIENLETKIKWLEDYKKQYEELNNTFDMNGGLITFDDKTRSEVDNTIKYFQNELDKVKLDIKIANMDEWKKDLMKLYGFDNETVGKLLDNNKATGATWVEKGLEERLKQRENANQTYEKFGIKQTKDATKNEAIEWAKTLVSDVNKLIETGRFGAVNNGELDNASKAYLEAINKAKESLVNLGVPADEIAEIFENTSDEMEKVIQDVITSLSDLSTYLMKIATGRDANGNFIEGNTTTRVGAMAGAMAINGAQGSNAGDIANGAMQGASVGGVIGAIVGALVALAMKAQTFTDALEDLEGIINPLIRAVNAILKPITSIARVIINFISPMLEGLADVIEKVFDFFFGWLNKYADDSREASRAKEKEIEQMKRLTDEYNNLYSAMKEQEEYYLKQKSLLIADTYKENAVRKVNDMILTDKGVFSTSPQDTIMAMKHPESLLGGGKTEVNVQVIDNVGVNGNVRQEGNNIFIELISQKIASDYADGSNGWATAVAVQQQSSGGRSISL